MSELLMKARSADRDHEEKNYELQSRKPLQLYRAKDAGLGTSRLHGNQRVGSPEVPEEFHAANQAVPGASPVVGLQRAQRADTFAVVGQELPCTLDGTMIDSTAITPRVMKTRQAARYLGVSAWKLRNLVQSGEIPCILGDGTSPWLFDKLDLDAWIQRRKQTL